MAPAAKKKINFWEDPTFQAFYNPLMEKGLAGRNMEQNRLNTLRTDTYGASGALAQNQLAATNDQNRIAEEMAYRGMLSSGAYAGPEKGRGTQSQADYGAQRRGIEQGYTSQTNPMNLLEQGLKMNPDGSISPLAPGEDIVDPSTGQKVKYDWASQTSAGRQAKLAALAQYATATAKTQV
jgi:hypothetical protein